jgi:hypothetical protein
MSQSNKEYTLYDVYLAIQDEIDNISYIEKEEQINAIIYSINIICNYNIDIDDPINNDFLKSIKQECSNAFDNLNYPQIEKYESEMCYITEMFQTQTMVMIEAAIEEFNKFCVPCSANLKTF